eukprot:GHUV01052555.1.p1 GENE.GHUV01052555.1~~GHUV01052555.1.p1  ORF type:complete len:149 (+),score=13.24 GHUV01052555.1:11-457(+)
MSRISSSKPRSTIRSASSRARYLRGITGQMQRHRYLATGSCFNSTWTVLCVHPNCSACQYQPKHIEPSLVEALQSDAAAAILVGHCQPAYIQVHPSLVEQIFQAARSCHHDMYSLAQHVHLRAHVNAANTQHHSQLREATLQGTSPHS